jgi:hypothetical protein
MEQKSNALSEKPPLTLSILLRLAGLGFTSGLLVGEIIDIAYPINGALDYFSPTWVIPSLGIELCWWIAILYGIAGMILAVSYPLFDRWKNQKPHGGLNPSWRFVLVALACFLVQWFTGPFLYRIGVPNIGVLFFTVPTGLLVWWVFDGTKGGLFMCILTAVCGPLVEITMINGFHLYSYTSPDIFGIPLWITGAYICGAPVNGLLGRKYLAFLLRSK